MATYVVTPLYDSNICRLCAAENNEGIFIYENENDLNSIINRYLPIKVEDDKKLPRTICPGCHIQLASTKHFFDLIIDGQSQLRELWSQELAIQKTWDREKRLFVETLEGSRIAFLADENCYDNDLFIKLLPSDPLFGEGHELSLQMEGLEKPKRKRGRPRKQSVPPKETSKKEHAVAASKSSEEATQKEEDEEELGLDENGRRRRRRKPPQRLMETVAGKELDRILREEGAIDNDDSDGSGDVENGPIGGDEDEPQECEATESEPPGEIIGHLTKPDGSKGEPIIATLLSKDRGTPRKKRCNKFLCDFCNHTFKDRTRWIRHRVSHKGFRFQCCNLNCLELFTCRSKLNEHQALKGHEGWEIVEIDEEICLQAEKSESEEKEIKQVICAVCSNEYKSTEELAMHVEVDHCLVKESFNDMLPVTLIAEGKDGEIKLQTVAKSDEKFSPKPPSGKHECDECDRTFNHTSSLIYHKESCHNGGRRFVCSKCNRAFTHKQLLQRHQMVHSDVRPFPCSNCNMTFKTKSNLLNHRVVHTGEKKFSCDSCGQQFAHKTSLSLHKSWHQGIRPFKCSFCSKCFIQRGNLREHMRIHNGEKPFRCNFCGKKFTTSSQQKLHIKRHTGDRPWKCQYCSKPFLHKDTWRTHERRHTGEKPYHCSYCNRAFAEHWSLKKHIRLHTGEKPYKCNFCGKEFADCSNLTKHKKIHSSNTSTMGQNQVWNLIRSHLNDGPATTEDLKQVIFVAYQDSEDKDLVPDIEPEQRRVVEEVAETQNTMAFLDEDGNPVQLPLPDGKSVEILSLDLETNIVKVRTSEGWTMLLQLPHDREIVEEEMLEEIRLAIASSDLSTFPNSEIYQTPNFTQAPKETTDSTNKLPKYPNVFTTNQQSAAASIQFQLEEPNDSDSHFEEDSTSTQQTYTLKLEKPIELVGDFAMDALKEQFLVTE